MPQILTIMPLGLKKRFARRSGSHQVFADQKRVKACVLQLIDLCPVLNTAFTYLDDVGRNSSREPERCIEP